jgi:hypothetical protein
MKNIVKIITVLFIMSTIQLSAYTNKTNTTQQNNKIKPYSAPSAAKSFPLRQGFGGQVGGHGKAMKGKPYSAKATKGKPEYYKPGHSDGLQNYPGKTIDAGMNTKMLPTNSASYMGNDVSF